MNNYDRKRISFGEATSNDNGKTSGSGLIGVLAGIIGVLVFAATSACLYFHVDGVTMELIDKAIALIGISALLLGVRKVSPAMGNSTAAKIVKNIEDNIENKNEKG